MEVLREEAFVGLGQPVDDVSILVLMEVLREVVPPGAPVVTNGFQSLF